MPSFLTQCPHCLTPFRVTDTQLEAAAGQVRCGACLGIFSATSNRITLKQTPEEAAVSGAPAEGAATEVEVNSKEAESEAPTLEPHESTAPEPELVLDIASHERDFDIPLGDFDLDTDEDFEVDEEQPETEEEEQDADYDDDFEDEDEVEVDDEVEDEEVPEDLPEPPAHRLPYARTVTDKAELRQYLAELEDDEALEPLDDSTLDSVAEEPVTLVATQRRGIGYTLGLLSVNLLLVAVLALQYVNANLDTLRGSARLAPVMPWICRVLECPVIERSQLSRLVSEQLLVRSHPRYAQALEVSFTFRNDAAATQPFPAIELGFSDTNKQLLANRLFKPAEYLPRELQTSEMPPQSSLQITLELADPGSEAVNYALAFRAP